MKLERVNLGEVEGELKECGRIGEMRGESVGYAGSAFRPRVGSDIHLNIGYYRTSAGSEMIGISSVDSDHT